MNLTAASPLSVIVGDKELLTSGVVHLQNQKEISFRLANLNFIFRFTSDTDKPRFTGEMVEDKLILNLFNFKNSLGEGRLDPVQIGTFESRKLYVTWYVNTVEVETDSRIFQYAFYLGGRDE